MALSRSTFATKSPAEVSAFLKDNLGIPEEISKAFESMDMYKIITRHSCVPVIDEFVNGAALLDLTEIDVKDICKKIGPTKNICRFISQLINDPVTPVTSSLPLVDTSGSLPSIEQSGSQSSVGRSGPILELTPRSLFLESDDNSSVASTSSSSSSVFRIPERWRPSIMACINAPNDMEAKRLLTPSIRNEIVRDLVYTIWPRPTSKECTFVGRRLVSKYSFMKDQGEGITGYGSWEKKIIDRVHNTRTKRKMIEESVDAPIPKKGRPKSNSTRNRYPPVTGDYGDDTCFTRNIEKIKSEMETANPRKQVLLQLMNETFARRREMVLSGGQVSNIIESFPCLKLYPIVQQEICMILGKKDILTIAIESWIMWSKAITDYAESLTTKSIVRVREKYSEAYKDDPEQDSKLALSLLIQLLTKKALLSDCLAKMYSDFDYTENPDEIASKSKIASPIIGCISNGVSESNYFIFIEGCITSHTKSFSKALIIWFASHYIYNLEYCKDIKETATFIQEFVFSLPSQDKKTSSYLSISTSIKNFIEQ